MTVYVLDVASYQGGLDTATAAASGYSIVNLKVSHGLTRKAVHPDVAGWVDRARAAGMGISTFHYLTADAPGEAQAEYAYARIAELGLAAGTAHQLDVESDPTPSLASVRGYLTRMAQLLGRPVALYTGDWWWRPRGWQVADLSPYLWAAPNAGYLPRYPGDGSEHWRAGYGGWADLAVMQYAVGPVAGVDISKSAIRDPGVWRDLTIGRPGMSYAPATLQAARSFYITTVRAAGYDIDPLSVGIVGDDSHAKSGTGYHLGKDALKSDAYSIVESSRDRNGLTDAAAALDLGWFSIVVHGKTCNLRSFSAWLVKQCQNDEPDVRFIREVIYSLDGQTVKRWDRLGRRTTGDSSHLTHTHESHFRDTEGQDKTAHLRRYFTEIGFLEDDMALTEADAELVASKVWGRPLGTNGSAGGQVQTIFGRTGSTTNNQIPALAAAVASVLTNVEADDGDREALEAAIQAAGEQAVADLLTQLGSQPVDEIATALRAALGPERAAAVGALLAS